MELQITTKQNEFISTTADEVLYGGAAGGGKSYGQVIDALLYSQKYAGSKQVILRRTFPELDRSIIRTAMGLYPKSMYSYNSQGHSMKMQNGSIIDFSYCATNRDLIKFQSIDYDTIRFDELTHFTEYQYSYITSRLRGANSFPKQIKSTTNPGNVGHTWVKKRFVSPAPAGKMFTGDKGTRIFIPAKVDDNTFLTKHDPDYIKRLESLPEAERKALRYGDWDIFEGQYFSEFNRDIHVMEPFTIPEHWTRYRVLDYGLDMLACYWIAVDPLDRVYVYRELYEGKDSGEGHQGLMISEAAAKICALTDEPIYLTVAPPDLWSRTKDTGKSIELQFGEGGVPLVKAKADRVAGWFNLKEWLKVYPDEIGEPCARLRIFNNCVNLIRCLPALIHDKKNVDDCAKEPHEITHAPDAIRYFVSYITMGYAEEEYEQYDPYDSFLKYGT